MFKTFVALGILLLHVLWVRAKPSTSPSTSTMRVGVVRSFFGEDARPKIGELLKAKGKMSFLTQTFGKFVREQTGMDGKLVMAGDYRRLARMLRSKQIDVGILHGYEFAWAQQEYSELEPLMIAIFRDRMLTANLVVRKDCAADQIDDLKGKKLAVPQHNKGHCRLFLDRECKKRGETKEFFGEIIRSENVRAALDELAYGSVEGALVDGELLDSYAQLKPGCFERLKVLARSELFPAAALVYRPGSVDEAVLKRFREGLARAHKSISGKDTMLLFKIGTFELPPADYQRQLEEVRRAYPSPNATALKVAENGAGK